MVFNTVVLIWDCTSCRPILCAIILAIKQFRPPLFNNSILSITCVIAQRIGLSPCSPQ